MKKLFIIKIGGNVLDDGSSLRQFLIDFAKVDGLKILIHGGGKVATKVGDKLGIESKYSNGRRITDGPTLDVVSMVYGGLINKQLVATLQQLGCNALGMTGADGNVLHAVKRPVKEIDFGYVGDITEKGVNVSLLQTLLDQSIVPVFAPLTHGEGSLLNTNADTISSVLAIALSRLYAVRLIFCFEKQGVLRDVDQPDSVIAHLNESLYKDLLSQEALHDGILPKLENAFAAIHAGVHEIVIGDSTELVANTGHQTKGTLITL